MHAFARPQVRPSLEIAGDADLGAATASTLALDFDLRRGARGGSSPAAVIVLTARENVRALLDDVRSRPYAPVMVLLDDCSVAERIALLEAGADDVMSGACEPAELLARLRALVRRAARPPNAVLRVDDLEIDVARHAVRRGARSIELSRLELGLLLALARHEGAVVPHDILIREVWGTCKNMATVHTFVSYLRAKLESGGEPPLVHTVRGVGYALRSHRTPATPLRAALA